MLRPMAKPLQMGCRAAAASARDEGGIAPPFEDQRRVLRQFDGPGDPMALGARLLQHRAAEALVHQDAEGGIPSARPAGGAIDEPLEIRDPRERLAMALGDALELDAMVE